MWNLKSKTSEQTKQNRNRVIDTESKLVVARGSTGLGKIDEGALKGTNLQLENK